MATKKSKPTFNQPTPTEWLAKAVPNKEYANTYDWTVEGKPFIGAYPTGKPCTFTPLIATIDFGRSNAEKRANAKLIASAPALLKALQEIESIYSDMKEKKKLSFIEGALLLSVQQAIKQSK